MTDVYFEKGFIRERVIYGRNVCKVSATNSFSSSVERENSFLLIFGGEEERGDVWVALVQLVLRIGVRRSNET